MKPASSQPERPADNTSNPEAPADTATQPPVSPIVAHATGASNVLDGVEQPTAVHYGDPLGEQRRLENRVGVVDCWGDVAVRITGEDRLTWLNSLISQKVDALPAGEFTRSLVLDAQGRVLHYFGISATSDALILDIPADQADALQTYLERMIFWSQVTITRLPWAKIRLLTTGDRELLAGLDSPSGEFSRDGELLRAPTAAAPETQRLGFIRDVWVQENSLLDAWDRLVAAGAHPTGRMASEALRIASRDPVVEVDTDERTIPHEVLAFVGPLTGEATTLALESAGPSSAAVHLNKGCYRGQETVSRVQNLGKAPRSLVLLHLDGSANALPSPGTAITAGGKPIGWVGSSSHDAELGPIALGVVKRAVVEALATPGKKVPPLEIAGDTPVAVAIDPDDIARDDIIRPGRAAVNRLRTR